MSAAGFAERDVLEWPVDKFYLISEALVRHKAREQAAQATTLMTSIGAALSGKGGKEFINDLMKEGGVDG